MKLSEMLIYADIEQLSEIAKRYQCNCSSHSKHDLIQSILSHSYREDIMSAQFDNMTAQQKHLLSFLLFEPQKKYSVEELKAKIKYCRFIEQEPPKRKTKKQAIVLPLEQRIIKQLKDEGWLFKEQGLAHHVLYQIPEDKCEYFRAHIAKQFQMNLTTYTQVEVVRNEAGYIVEDLKAILQFIHSQHIKINEIQLMNKRTLQQLINMLYINEAIPGKGAWKFGYGKKFGEYPDRLALLYQFAVTSGWIEENDTLQLSIKGQQLLNEGFKLDIVKVIEYWLAIYKKPIPNLKALTYFIYVSLKQWRSVDELQIQLLPYIKTYYFDNEEAILHKRILKMLLHFGVIELGQDDKQQLMAKLTDFGAEWLKRALKLDERGRYIT